MVSAGISAGSHFISVMLGVAVIAVVVVVGVVAVRNALFATALPD